MSDYLTRRLKWFLLFGATILMAGILLACVAELRNSEWIGEFAGKPNSYLLNENNSERWLLFVQANNELLDWAFDVLVPLGTGAVLSSIGGLAWVSQGRFSVRTLLIGTTYLSLLIGFPLGLVRPRLQNPQIVYRPTIGDIFFEQHLGESRSGVSVMTSRKVFVAATPLLVLIPIFFWPCRSQQTAST
jgi:hypothetical protein